jgi:hypothetical protein
MWRRGDDTTVTCIACGEELDRDDAREYDKHGDRWSRREKAFEYLCKPCHRELCHQPRGDLEATLAELDTAASARRFIERYYEAIERRTESDRDVSDR